MRKSYDALLKEYDESVTELAKQQRRVYDLTDSVNKKRADVTYEKALGYLNKAVWWINELVYIVDVKKQGSSAWVSTWIINTDDMRYGAFLLHHPNDEFLANPPIDNPEPFQTFIRDTMKEAGKIYRQYKGERNGRSASAHKA